MKFTEKQYEEILQIGILMAVEKNHNRLFSLILESAMNVSGCDGGTLYLYENGELRFRLMRTISQNRYEGRDGETSILPPVPFKEENVCAYAAIHDKVVNIADVYHCEEFDFSGPRKYDEMTGYRTCSMLVIPLKNPRGDLIGVLQLLNALQDGEVVPFAKGYESIVHSLASQVAITITNLRYMEEIKDLMYSYVETMAAIIDARTPYNGSHTKNVTRYVSDFLDFLNREYEKGEFDESFDENRKEQLVFAASLHDIGKMNVPLSIMNKTTKLVHRLDGLVARYKLIKAYLKVDLYEGRIDREEFEARCYELVEAETLVREVNESYILKEDQEKRLIELSEKSYIEMDGKIVPFLTPEETECLLVKKGNLTQKERRIMENHVVSTSEILSHIHFSTHFKDVPRWAGAHHEFLDGSGYPGHLTAADMPSEIRILSMIDIFEALIAVDRPYKRPIPLDESLLVLHQMCEDGKLDEKFVSMFEKYIKQQENGEPG